ncbi:thiol reductant ABC exporter subunit CydD [Sagittula marina]
MAGAERVTQRQQDTNRAGLIGAALSLAAALIWPFQAWLVAALLGRLLSGEAALVWPTVAGFVALGLVRSALEAGSHAALARHADTVLATLRTEVVGGERRTLDTSSIGGPGALSALVSEKAEALRPYLMRYRPARLRATVVPLVILVLAFWNAWAVGVVLLLSGPLIPLFMALVGWAAKDASARQMDEIGSLGDLLVDRLAALADLRLIGAGKAVTDDFAEASERLRGKTMAVLRVAFLSSTVLELFAALGVAMVAVWTGFSLLEQVHWGGDVTPTTGIWLLLLAPEFFQPLRDLASAWHDKAAADAVQEELQNWRGQERAAMPGHGQGGVAITGVLALNNISLHRGDRQIHLPDLEIRPGTRIALTGPSGAGKTTLLRLLAGLERPETGELTLDGQPLADRLDDWRAGLGWMPQAPHFLARSLRYNVGFGASLGGEVAQAALGPVVQGLPKGDLTPLGERGAGLSGGEARRVTLARALHGAPQVLLADEPTADLDDDTAEAVTRGLLSHKGTLIVATHDLRLAAQMDRVIDLGDTQ